MQEVEIEVLKDIFILKGEIDKYYEEAPVTLWRAKKKNGNGSIFELIEKDKMLSNGRPRPSDVRIESRNGMGWVYCKPVPRGISTFDKSNIFKGKWEYYKIPQGTKLPLGLAIVKDKFNPRLKATHYTIAPARDMPLDYFKQLLNELALSCRKEVT